FIDRKRGVMPPTGYEDAQDGSWFLTYLIDNEEIWAIVKDGEWKGFSVDPHPVSSGAVVVSSFAISAS
ncbi:MAG: XkdF-like putative serine protease domain-containing protein, partial [bacterium]